MRLVYFAHVRETIGFDAEDRDLPTGVRTVTDCIDWLSRLGPHYAAAFADPTRLRFALDQQLVQEHALIEGGGELAIFPPVTGG